ncbi:transmembrane emp24 domain-containing protein eca-like [Drosophila elegans]|uniref:transmembrane emp24 domain-containing protein eca-like n=1 Tax=Drosophila elegans TaxID=30023 RepID=UPI0007E7D9D8|nr:transmembrane emp24 domain-containing protein eca-like [Drosophila elegans]
MEKRFIWLVLCILHSSNGLYFKMREKERKCFIQATPEDETVIVQYKAEVEDPRSGGFMPMSPGIGMHVEVRDSNEKVIISRVYGSEARLMFTTFWPGDHHICLQSNSSAWFEGALLRVHMEIKTGERTADYARIGRTEPLDYMQLRVRQLMNKADEIVKQQNFQRYREQLFLESHNNLYSELIFISIVQVVVLLTFMAIQYRLLFGNKPLFLAYCKALSDEELTRFRTPEAYRALMTLLGPNGQGLTTSAISEWVFQLQDPESRDEQEQIIISEKLQSRVTEFAGKFFRNRETAIPGNPYGSHYASNVQLTNILADVQRSRSGHLKGDTFLLVCECEDCRVKAPKGLDKKPLM